MGPLTVDKTAVAVEGRPLIGDFHQEALNSGRRRKKRACLPFHAEPRRRSPAEKSIAACIAQKACRR